MGYRGLGLAVFPTSEETDVQALLKQLITSKEYAVIFLTEPVYKACDSVIAEHRYDFLPALVSIPSAAGNEGIGLRATEEAVRRAVGFDILSNREAQEEADDHK